MGRQTPGKAAGQGWALGRRRAGKPGTPAATAAGRVFQQTAAEKYRARIFNPGWLADHLDKCRILPQDTRATLCALTTGSIALTIRRYTPRTQRLLVCGGGARNRQLIKTLETALAPIRVESTLLYGVDPDWV